MFLTTGQLAEALNCNISTAKRLINTGVLPRIEHRGNRSVVPVDVVQSLVALPPTPTHTLPTAETAVLRVDAAVPAEGTDRQERSWYGFRADLSETDNLLGLRGWWRLDPARVAAGQLIIVTVSSFVVAVLTGLDDWDGPVDGRHRFTNARMAGYLTDLTKPASVTTQSTPADAALAAPLLGTRLRTKPGAPIAYIHTPIPTPAAASVSQVV